MKLNDDFLKFIFFEFNRFDIQLTPKQNRSKAPIHKTTIKNEEQELFLTSINLDTERSIKITPAFIFFVLKSRKL